MVAERGPETAIGAVASPRRPGIRRPCVTGGWGGHKGDRDGGRPRMTGGCGRPRVTGGCAAEGDRQQRRAQGDRWLRRAHGDPALQRARGGPGGGRSPSVANGEQESLDGQRAAGGPHWPLGERRPAVADGAGLSTLPCPWLRQPQQSLGQDANHALAMDSAALAMG